MRWFWLDRVLKFLFLLFVLLFAEEFWDDHISGRPRVH